MSFIYTYIEGSNDSRRLGLGALILILKDPDPYIEFDSNPDPVKEHATNHKHRLDKNASS